MSDEIERWLHSINADKINVVIALLRDQCVHYQIGSLIIAPYENEYFRAKFIGERRRRRRRGREGGREGEGGGSERSKISSLVDVHVHVLIYYSY